MKVQTFGYFFREAFRSMWQNGWMSVASISTVAISLLILGISLLLVMNSHYAAAAIESDLEIVLSLKNDIDAKQTQAVADRLRGNSRVAEVIFVSKQEAMSAMRKQVRPELLRALGEDNPFPDQFRVKAKDPNDVASLADEFGKIPGVELVKYGQGVVERLLRLTQWVRIVGLSVMGLIGLAAVFLISTTIRLTVFARRREINIMKFVGATNWFIRWPFLLEGTFLGLIGSLLAIVLVYALYTPVAEYVRTSLPFVPLRADSGFLLTISQILLASGVFIGALGSSISLRKFLKV
ncbi:cell division protein ftsx, putative [Heliomicrobium modesticaldum Ice1]|uniref:Cell division protein FtsX n=1 Tax=Heliobacterium modesticaldum (strain ATCC 51547 / Ice1) TaxID=498761 RepID=B0TGY1_HELMI|nr:permease-like cell division protein FtsX [Heliomicrobium modesticaldum]ABZ83306.1 cell division protein ftsx, putative [Heliomicrobium modesticaldum Ice1]